MDVQLQTQEQQIQKTLYQTSNTFNNSWILDEWFKQWEILAYEK